MLTDFEILRSIYNAFDPFEPLEAGSPVYVNCSAVRGDENILVDVGRQITYSDRITHQLYTGSSTLPPKRPTLTPKMPNTPTFCWPAPATC